VRGFTINGFEDDGISLFCADGWVVQEMSPRQPGVRDLPSHSGPGTVIDNVATGSHDTGIYIGQSHDVRVTHNFAMGNVSASSSRTAATRAWTHRVDRQHGWPLTFTNIFLDVKQNVHNRVDHNFIHDNNAPNSCLDPSDEGAPCRAGRDFSCSRRTTTSSITTSSRQRLLRDRGPTIDAEQSSRRRCAR